MKTAIYGLALSLVAGAALAQDAPGAAAQAAPAGPETGSVPTPGGGDAVTEGPGAPDQEPPDGAGPPGGPQDADAPPPRRPPMHLDAGEGKGARFRIRSPEFSVGVKCPEDEAMKSCVDALMPLIDKLVAARR